MQKIITKKQIRLKHYNYSEDGYYFVTICSRNREIIFGEYIENTVGTGLAPVRDNVRCENNIKLSDLGNIIEKQWIDIPNQYDNVGLDQYIIMPNHLHGIIIIHKWTGASPVPTISKIIRSFKSKSTLEYVKYINDNNLNVSGKIGQRSFYDHIIRNEKS